MRVFNSTYTFVVNNLNVSTHNRLDAVGFTAAVEFDKATDIGDIGNGKSKRINLAARFTKSSTPSRPS